MPSNHVFARHVRGPRANKKPRNVPISGACYVARAWEPNADYTNFSVPSNPTERSSLSGVNPSVM
jgi:hypothetical protein